MDDFVAVQEGETLGHVFANIGNLRLSQGLLQLHHDAVQGSAVAVLDEHLLESGYSQRLLMIPVK